MTQTALGNWPRCSRPPTMNAVTTSARPSRFGTRGGGATGPDRARRAVRSRGPAPGWGRISALAAGDPLGLRRAAGDLASEATQLDHDGQAAARAASLDLIWVAFLIDASSLGLDPHRSTTS